MSSLTDEQWRLLVKDIESRVAAHAPEWTDHSDSDPGVTLLQLFAFLSEDLLTRANRIPERGLPAAMRAVTALSSLDGLCGGTSGLVRTHFFSGRLLTAEDLEAEQRYFRDRHRRHNRGLHGVGIVEGLTVTVDNSGDDASVEVGPGIALTPSGDEVFVPEPLTCKITASPPCYVVLQYVDRLIDPTPSLKEGSLPTPSRISEGFVVTFEAAMSTTAVTLARLIRDSQGWRVDHAFSPPRLKTATT